MENDNTKTSPYKTHYFIIGIMMLLGGLGQIILFIKNELDPSISTVILHSITTLGGLAFIIIAFRNKNSI